MPQMSPMNWFILFIYFNMALYLCMVKLFYLSSIKLDLVSTKSEFKMNKFMVMI